jgi:cell division ATPase FtsA
MIKLFGKREIPFLILDKKKGSPFLVLDIGSEAVKSLIIKKENNNLIILGAGLQYLNIDSFSMTNDFQMNSMSNTILKSIQEASNNFVLFSNEKKKDLPVLITLSPDILKLKIISEEFERKKESKISKSEAESILQDTLIKVKKKISDDFLKNHGILGSDIKWINFKIIGRKINGYMVPRIQGCNGKNLEIKVLVSFLPKKHFDAIENICYNLNLRSFRIVNIGQGLISFFGQAIKTGVFIDIGGSVSQVLMLKDGILDRVEELNIGGHRFSQALSEVLAIDKDSARILKHKYASNDLTEEVKQRIKGILFSEKDFWKSNLEKSFKKLGKVYIFGGGSLTPEIRESLRSVVVYPKHLKNIKNLTKNLDNPQFITALLVSYYARENF